MPDAAHLAHQARYRAHLRRAKAHRRTDNNGQRRAADAADAMRAERDVLAILDEPDPPGLDAILAAWEAAHDADRR